MMANRPIDPVTELLRNEQVRERSTRRTRIVLLAVVGVVVLMHVLAARGLVAEPGADLALSAGALVAAIFLGSPEKRQ
jgi:threonine/homoserine efflux transporter RhtA